ncbi:MAG: glycosyltransferase family 4 protein [Lentisphaerae bacterium]|nr:glycosyltransferase family 4 protein [Lentisphaerota bacterium]
MRVAVVHYHLRPGGVTRVIQHSVRALQARSVDVVVLAGAVPESPWPCPVAVVEGLDYRAEASVTGRAARTLAKLLQTSAARALGRAPDLWHIHNHAVGKNPVLTLAVHYLAGEGAQLLLHVHDFAEDGRPELYHRLLRAVAGGDREKLGLVAYPRAPQVHYAALNQRDIRTLRSAGADPAALHYLPNPVIAPAEDGSKAAVPWEGQHRFLYPTRALRRKNIGEVILWALLGQARDAFALTLAPTSESDRIVYGAWKRYARRWRLPIQFEVGLTCGVSLRAWMGAATAVMTTSVAEGFGLALLEPWLAERPVVGRDLPDITGEFRANGVCLSRLYERLEVPLKWIGADTLRAALGRGLRKSYRAYRRPLPADAGERAYEAAVRKHTVDFGRLDETLQLAVIDTLRRFPRQQRHVRPGQLSPGAKDNIIRHNADLIKAECNLAQYGERLLAAYNQLLRSSPRAASQISADILLDSFLAPERFCLLRT